MQGGKLFRQAVTLDKTGLINQVLSTASRHRSNNTFIISISDSIFIKNYQALAIRIIIEAVGEESANCAKDAMEYRRRDICSAIKERLFVKIAKEL